MADIFDEIEEDLKKDKMDEAWKKYGKYVIAVAVLIVVGTIGYTQWISYTSGQAADQANRFDQALTTITSGETEQGLKQLDAIAGDSGAGYQMLARLEKAALLAEDGKKAEAVALYDQIAADSQLDEMYRGLATVLSVMHDAENSAPSDLLAKLAPQLEAGATWRYTALEVAAGLHLKAGDKAAAADQLKVIVDDANSPAELRRRATELLRALEG